MIPGRFAVVPPRHVPARPPATRRQGRKDESRDASRRRGFRFARRCSGLLAAAARAGVADLHAEVLQQRSLGELELRDGGLQLDDRLKLAELRVREGVLEGEHVEVGRRADLELAQLGLELAVGELAAQGRGCDLLAPGSRTLRTCWRMS